MRRQQGILGTIAILVLVFISCSNPQEDSRTAADKDLMLTIRSVSPGMLRNSIPAPLTEHTPSSEDRVIFHHPDGDLVSCKLEQGMVVRVWGMSLEDHGQPVLQAGADTRLVVDFFGEPPKLLKLSRYDAWLYPESGLRIDVADKQVEHIWLANQEEFHRLNKLDE